MKQRSHSYKGSRPGTDGVDGANTMANPNTTGPMTKLSDVKVAGSTGSVSVKPQNNYPNGMS